MSFIAYYAAVVVYLDLLSNSEYRLCRPHDIVLMYNAYIPSPSPCWCVCVCMCVYVCSIVLQEISDLKMKMGRNILYTLQILCARLQHLLFTNQERQTGN